MVEKTCKQSSYVTNGEVLKANKYETSFQEPVEKSSVEDDNEIGNSVSHVSDKLNYTKN